MGRALKNPGFSFILVVLLFISMVLPNQQASAATMNVSKSWSLPASGKSLFNPIFQTDGSMFIGNSRLINVVYHADFMTVDAKGTKKSTWSINGASQGEGDFLLGGTPTSPVIYSVDYTKGIISTYNQKGQLIWKKDYPDAILNTLATTDPNGNIIFSVGTKLYRYTPQNKETLNMNLPSYKDNSGQTRYYDSIPYYKFLKDGSFYTLSSNVVSKYNANGSKVWGKSFISTADLPYLQGASFKYVDDKNTAYVQASFYKPDPKNYSNDERYLMIYKVDTNGNVLSFNKISNESSYGLHFFDQYNSVFHLVTDSGNYYTFNEKGVLLEKQVFLPTVKSGDYSYIDGTVYDVKRMSSTGGLYILAWESGKNHLIYIDPTGKRQWDKEILGSDSCFEIFKDEILIKGPNYTLYNYSKDGNLNWKYSYGTCDYLDVYFNEKTSMVYTQTYKWTDDGKGNYYPNSTITALKETTVEPVTGVSLKLDMKAGSTVSFEALVSPANATNKLVTWTSSNTKAATVDSKGTVKAIKAGTATITATTKDGAKKASIEVTVK
jgi:hypothetical protein